jgi:hypothetical protein
MRPQFGGEKAPEKKRRRIRWMWKGEEEMEEKKGQDGSGELQCAGFAPRARLYPD